MGAIEHLKTLVREYSPFGVLAPQKPRHLLALLETLQENYGRWHRAWKVLNGPCNGCAVQTDGLKDNVLPHQPHLCLVRMGLIEEVLRDEADLSAFADAAKVARMGNDRIERLGRLTGPMLWRRGEKGYRTVSFAEAYDLAAEWIEGRRGSRCGFFTTSKAVGNEEYYAFQQFARVVGKTNNVDSCARQCHAASVTALKATVGVGASSGTLSDFMNTDVLVLAGTNLANNQPLTLRYIEKGRARRGGRPYVIVINPYREPGLERYWVPSSPRSALFGSRICDDFVQVRAGGDIAFFNGVVKILIEESLLTGEHRAFIETRTNGFEKLADALAGQSIDDLAEAGGATTEQMRRVAMVLARCENAVFCWGMGLTQHRRGTDNVKAIMNLALVLGQLGKAHAGVAPLRGQSGVQASGECGVAPDIFPGGSTVNAESAKRFSAVWGAKVPARRGLATGKMIETADRGKIELLMSLGGNLRETMPDRRYVQRVLSKVPYRIRLDVMMNSEAMIEPGEASLVIPIRNWYEWDSVFTTTATDRTIRAFRGTLPMRWAGLPESWFALREIARRVLGDELRGFSYQSTQQIREMMARTIGVYEGIASLSQPHRQMQWGGEYLFKNGFTNMPQHRAVFSVLKPDAHKVPEGCLMLSTRRGFGQWNSQHRISVAKDSLTGATTRKAVLMHPDDVASLGLNHGERIRVTAEHGASVEGVCWADGGMRPGHVQAFWPLANDLIRRGVYDKPSCEPDYNVVVRVVKI
ncbi:MAG: molybdopterin-dependent oxidoreductase [Phycisphaerae bacterium]